MLRASPRAGAPRGGRDHGEGGTHRGPEGNRGFGAGLEGLLVDSDPSAPTGHPSPRAGGAWRGWGPPVPPAGPAEPAPPPPPPSSSAAGAWRRAAATPSPTPAPSCPEPQGAHRGQLGTPWPRGTHPPAPSELRGGVPVTTQDHPDPTSPPASASPCSQPPAPTPWGARGDGALLLPRAGSPPSVSQLGTRHSPLGPGTPPVLPSGWETPPNLSPAPLHAPKSGPQPPPG